LLNAKALDTFAPCGPALVLMDEIDDLQALQLTTRVNGDTVQSASTGLMINSVAALIEYVTTLLTLHPGDIIATGTPSGVGAASNPPRFLSPGDVVEVSIDGIGSISNPVVAGQVLVLPSDFSSDGTELLAAETRADSR
jgi:2-keto-4-pentenoate hydratase/2-oxohepta-3-ene-1,7-dioic acid hydratase in catechol pathway